jgi:hypothetical protein
MSVSKMAVGKYNEQQAFGMSTTPLIRPSIGAAPSSCRLDASTPNPPGPQDLVQGSLDAKDSALNWM